MSVPILVTTAKSFSHSIYEHIQSPLCFKWWTSRELNLGSTAKWLEHDETSTIVPSHPTVLPHCSTTYLHSWGIVVECLYFHATLVHLEESTVWSSEPLPLQLPFSAYREIDNVPDSENTQTPLWFYRRDQLCMELSMFGKVSPVPHWHI